MRKTRFRRMMSTLLSLALVLTTVLTQKVMTVSAEGEEGVSITAENYSEDEELGHSYYVGEGAETSTFGSILIPAGYHFIVDNAAVTASSVTMEAGAYLELQGSGSLAVTSISATPATEETPGSHLLLHNKDNRPSCISVLYDISNFDGTAASLVDIKDDADWEEFDFEYLQSGDIVGWGTNPGGEDPEEEEGPEENPEEEPESDPEEDENTAYEAAKEAVENGGFAFYVDSPTGDVGKTNLESYLETHLWDAFFGSVNGHNATYMEVFDSKDSMEIAVTLGNYCNTDTTIPNKAGTGYLPYYNFSITLQDSEDDSDDVVANGKVYILEGPYDVVAKFTKGTTVNYVIKDCSVLALEGSVIFEGAYDMVTEDNGSKNPNVEFFGNGAEPVSTWDSGNPEYVFAGHMTEEHIPGIYNKGTHEDEGQTKYNAISTAFIVMQESCIPIKVTGNGENGTSAAWGWTSLSVYATNGTTVNSPKVFDVYVGDTEIYIDKVEAAAGKAISEIKCTLTNADKAVSITSDNGSYTVKPLSNFYDGIPLTITYADSTKAYIKINRVALDIGGGIPGDGSSAITVFHGSDNSRDYEVSSKYTIYGSFYYPNNKTAETNGRVNLQVTYTWADGSVTRKTVSPANALVITDATQGNTHVDDFILWTGDSSSRPVKVEAIAVVTGSDDTAFKGALIGAGAGIVWTE